MLNKKYMLNGSKKSTAKMYFTQKVHFQQISNIRQGFPPKFQAKLQITTQSSFPRSQ